MTELTTYWDKEFAYQDFPRDPLLGGDLLDGGEKLMVIGESESGKSYLVLQMALDLATQGNWLGYEVLRRCRVTLLQSELSIARYQQRYLKLRSNYQGDRVIDLAITSTESLKLDTDQGAELFARHVLATEPDVVIFDPVRAFYAGNENESHAVERWFDSISRAQLVNKLFSPIAVHHTRKAVQGFAKEVGTKAVARGSGLFVEGPSTVISLDVNEAQTNWTLYFTKTRNRERRPVPLQLTVNFKSGLFELDENEGV